MAFLAEQHLVAAKLVRRNGATRTGAERSGASARCRNAGAMSSRGMMRSTYPGGITISLPSEGESPIDFWPQSAKFWFRSVLEPASRG